MLQAWTQCVRNDSTYVIFNCGNFERIGVRHRATQTLYISDLIDIPNCKDPAYAKLHIGLYMSIYHDVLDRLKSHNQEESLKLPKGRKRRRIQVDSPSISKRPKTRALVAKLNEEKLAENKSREVNQLFAPYDKILRTYLDNDSGSSHASSYRLTAVLWYLQFPSSCNVYPLRTFSSTTGIVFP